MTLALRYYSYLNLRMICQGLQMELRYQRCNAFLRLGLGARIANRIFRRRPLLMAQHYDEKHAEILVTIYQYPDREALVLSHLDRASISGF